MSRQDIAFVTGANRGIGYSIAKHLIASGIDVIGTYHSNEDEAKAAETALGGESAKLRMLRLDIADHASFAAFAGRVEALLSREFQQQTLRYVVQNAGNIIHTRFDAATSEQLDNQYNIHFKGPYLLTVALLPLIRNGGRILNITSAATRFYLTDHGPYSAMKAATEVISLYMAKELGARGITVNVVQPGPTDTDMNPAEGPLKDVMHGFMAIKRHATGAEIAGLVAYLAGPEAGIITGAAYNIDGGFAA